MTEFYVPSTILLSYVQKYTVEDLKSFSLNEAVEFYREFINSDKGDVRTSAHIFANNFIVYKELREKLRNKYLGRDVKICFSLPRDIKIPAITDEDLEYYIAVDVKALKELKLRRTRIVDRILTSDLLFRLYYYLVQNYSDFKDCVAEFHKAETMLRNACCTVASRIQSLIHEYKDKSDYFTKFFNFYRSELLAGFKSACFPLLSWSTLLDWSIHMIIFTDRWEELGLDPFPNERIEDSRTIFEKEVQKYIEHLKTVTAGIKVLSTGAYNEYEALIYSMLPLAPLELGSLYNTAAKIGLDLDELEKTFNRLLSTQKIQLKDGYFQKVE